MKGPIPKSLNPQIPPCRQPQLPMKRTVRTFIAVEIDAALRQRVVELIAALAAARAEVKWVEPDNLHLTLVFLGENPFEFIENAKAQLAQTAAQTPAFSTSLKSVGVFPNEHSPRVIWLGIEQGRDELVLLAQQTLRRLVTIGFIPEKRPFSAHLTIGRVRAPITNVRTVLDRPYASRAFPVNELMLFQSHLKPTGPVYERLGQYELRK